MILLTTYVTIVTIETIKIERYFKYSMVYYFTSSHKNYTGNVETLWILLKMTKNAVLPVEFFNEEGVRLGPNQL